MDWTLFFSQLAASGITLSAVAWLTKSILTHQLSRDLETFKRQLAIDAEHDRIRFTRLHEKRAEIIEHTYREVVQIVRLIRMQNKESQNTKSVSDALLNSVLELTSYFHGNALYFDDETKAKFHRVFIDGVAPSLNIIALLGEIEPHIAKIKERLKRMEKDEESIDLAGPLIDKLREHLPQLNELAVDLEKEFQLILGVKKLR